MMDKLHKNLTREQVQKRKIAGYILLHLENHKSMSAHDLRYAVAGTLPRTINQSYTRGYTKRVYNQTNEVIKLLEGKRHIIRTGNRITPTAEGLKAFKAWRAVELFRSNQCAFHDAMIEIMDWCGDEGSMGYTKKMIDESISMYKQHQHIELKNGLEVLVNAGIIEINEEGRYRTNPEIETEVYKYMMPVGSFDRHVFMDKDYSPKNN